MYHSIKAELTGAAPLIINNGRLANPLDDYAKALKAATKKKPFTDADLEQVSKLEWYGGLYLDVNHHVCLPDYLIEATLIAAAKKTRQGVQAKSGIIVNGQFPLVYDGPSDIDELWEDKRFVFLTTAKPSFKGGTVLRTRPRFDEWALTVELEFNDEDLNHADIERFLITAGRVIGFGNWRPRYGRFEVSNIR